MRSPNLDIPDFVKKDIKALCLDDLYDFVIDLTQSLRFRKYIYRQNWRDSGMTANSWEWLRSQNTKTFRDVLEWTVTEVV